MYLRNSIARVLQQHKGLSIVTCVLRYQWEFVEVTVEGLVDPMATGRWGERESIR